MRCIFIFIYLYITTNTCFCVCMCILYIYIYTCVYGSYIIYYASGFHIYIYMYPYVFPTSSMYTINIHANKWTNKNTHTHTCAWLYPPSTPSFAQESCRETWAEHGQSAHGHGAHGPIHGFYVRGPAEGAETGHLAERQRLSRSAYRSRGRLGHGPMGVAVCFVFLWDMPKRKDGGYVGMCQKKPPWSSEEVWSSWPSFRNTQGDNKENMNYVNMSLVRLSDVCASCSVSYFDMVFGLYVEHEILKHGLPSGKTNSKASPILP